MSIALYISKLNNIFNEKLKEYYLQGINIVLHRSFSKDDEVYESKEDICFKFDIFFEEDKYKEYMNTMKENHIQSDIILNKIFKELFDKEKEISQRKLSDTTEEIKTIYIYL